jgi:hypothetical protein
MGVRGIIIVWSVLVSSVLSSILSPKTCRPPLPIDWFISQYQHLPSFSQNLTDRAKAASAALGTYIDIALSHVSDIDAVSVVVAGPWGPVTEHHVGKLKANDSSDHRIVNGDSIYRIASISKVSIRYFSCIIIGDHCARIAHSTIQRKALFG